VSTFVGTATRNWGRTSLGRHRANTPRSFECLDSEVGEESSQHELDLTLDGVRAVSYRRPFDQHAPRSRPKARGEDPTREQGLPCGSRTPLHCLVWDRRVGCPRPSRADLDWDGHDELALQRRVCVLGSSAPTSVEVPL
jgi:hypothetical protein